MFCFSAHLLIVSHFYFPCENRQRQREEGTGSCPKDPAGYGKNGYFVVLHWVRSVVAFVGFVMGLWFGCLGGWLMCRIVSRIVVYLLWYSLCFVFCFHSFLFFCFASGCYQPEGVYVYVYRVLIVERLRWLICSTEWFLNNVSHIFSKISWEHSRNISHFKLIRQPVFDYLWLPKWVKDGTHFTCALAFFHCQLRLQFSLEVSSTFA